MNNIDLMKVCVGCWCEFTVMDIDIEFYDKISPIFNGRKYNIPVPRLCPTCRQQRRMAIRNERKLYKRKSDFSGKSIISCYSPEWWYKVYEIGEWFSDKWDALTYGRDFDFNRWFFDQFNDLLKVVPFINVLVINNENSPYINLSANVKDCYLIFWSSQNIWCCYGRWVMNSEKIFDSNNVNKSFDCYQCVDIVNCNLCFYCIECYDSSSCFGCYDLIWCNNCIWCYNLRNKSYYINNKQYSKEEYMQIKSTYTDYKILLDISMSKAIHRHSNIKSSENCSWDYILRSRNVYQAYDVEDSQDCKYISNVLDMKDSYDIDFQAFNTFRIYDSLWVENAYNVYFSFWAIESNNVYYCYLVINCSNCFGCVGLRGKQYCIFNKQYTQKEYEIVVSRIIDHMLDWWYIKNDIERWEFFPAEISPFWYNETTASEYFPMEKNQAIGKWFKWMDKEYPINIPQWIAIIKAQDLPDMIDKVNEKWESIGYYDWSILDKAVICELTGKPFRIIKLELEFYRKHNIPLPRKHPDYRHEQRVQIRTSRKLYDRKCDKCEIDMKTPYSSDRPEIVYCEQCYNKEIYE